MNELSIWRFKTREEFYTTTKNQINWHKCMDNAFGQYLTNEEAFTLLANYVEKGIDPDPICGKICDRLGISRSEHANSLGGKSLDYYCFNVTCITNQPLPKNTGESLDYSFKKD